MLNNLVSVLPEEASPKLALVDYIAVQRSPEDAEKSLSDFIQQEPENFELRLKMLSLFQDQPDKIKVVLNEIIEDDPLGKYGIDAKNRLARLAISEKDFTQSEKLLDEVIVADQRNIDALTMRAGIYLQNKETDFAIADLRAIIRDNPESENALLMLAQAHLLNGNNNLVKENLERIVAINPQNLIAVQGLARILVQDNQADRALAILQRSWSPESRNSDIAIMLIDLHGQRQEWSDAEKYAEAIFDISEKKEIGHFMLAQSKLAQGDFHAAEIQYQKVLAHQPLAIEAISGLVAALMGQNDIAQAEKTVENVLTQKPDNVLFLNMRANLHIQQKQSAEAEKLLTRITELMPESEAAYKNLANLALMTQDTEKALNIYDKGLKKLPESIALLMDSALIYQVTNNEAAAGRFYEKVLLLQPENKLATNNLAVLLANSKEGPEKLKRGLELATKLKDINTASFQDTYGWLSYLNGEYDQAIPALEKAVSLQGNNPENYYHLAMAYLQQGRTVEAKRKFEKAVSEEASYTGLEQAKEELAKLQY